MSPSVASSVMRAANSKNCVACTIEYGTDAIAYEKWEPASRERLKLGAWEPGAIEGGTMRWDPKTRVLEVEAAARRVVVRRAATAAK